jgi:two-component system LytT family response regulator
MRAVIIEDEKQAINALKQELRENCPEVQILGTASKVKEAIDLISKLSPELVFLDIQLKDGNGFDVLSTIGTYDFKVIFTTAYSNFAIQAIKVSAIDYLLKPIDSIELIKAVQKAKIVNTNDLKNQIKTLIDNHNNPLNKKIAIPTTHGISVFESNEILRIQSEGNYSSIYFTNETKLLVAKTLKDFEELLRDNGFIRIHHSHIINLMHLKSYSNKDGGYVILNNKTTLPISKRKKSDFMSAINAIND